MMPDMDFMDLGARQENLNTRGEPILLQLCVVPAYALTVRLLLPVPWEKEVLLLGLPTPSLLPSVDQWL